MKRTKTGFIAFVLAIITVISAFPATFSYGEEVCAYALVTSASQLSAGDKVILAAYSGGSVYVATNRGYTYRPAAAALEKDGVIYGNPATETKKNLAYEFTVGMDNGYYTFYDGVYGGYLCAAGKNTSNRLYTAVSINDNCRFAISFDSEGGCFPLCKDTAYNGKMCFSSDISTSPVFYCTAESTSNVEKIYLYKYIGNEEPPAVEDSSETVTYLCSFSSFVAHYYKDTETVKYYGTYDGFLVDGFIYVFTLIDSRGASISSKNLNASDINNGNGNFSYSFYLSASAVAEFSQPFKVNVRCVHEPQAIQPSTAVVNVFESTPANITVSFVATEGGTLTGETVFSISDGTELSTLTFPTPTPNDDYNFAGWSATSGIINENTVITATFTKKTYTVIFYDRNGVVLDEQTVPHGESAKAPALDDYEGYYFVGWDKPTDNVISNIELRPIYSPKTYKITFYGIDDEAIDEQTVAHGIVPIAPQVPVIDGFVFTGWDKTIVAATEETSYKAIYEQITVKLDFVAEEGGVIVGTSTVYVPYGTELSTLKFPEGVPELHYDFIGWSKTAGAVIEDTVITARFTLKTYTVTFVGHDGTQLKAENVTAGEAATAPQVPVFEEWVFIGWDKEFSCVTTNMIVTAIYEKYSPLIGDVNDDGDVTAFDASLILQYDAALTGLDSMGLAAADVNGDGAVDCADAYYVLLYDAGLLDVFPAK